MEIDVFEKWMHKYLDVIIFIGYILFSIFLYLIRSEQSIYGYPDAEDYIGLSQYFYNVIFEQNFDFYDISVFRLFRPLVPFISSFFNLLLDARYSLLLTNIICFCLSGQILNRIFNEFDITDIFKIMGHFLFAFSTFALSFAITTLIESGSWFFEILTFYYILKFSKRKLLQEKKTVVILGILTLLAILAKDVNVFIAILIPYIYLKEFGLKKETIMNIIIFSIIVFIPIVAIQIYTFIIFDFTYLNYLFEQTVSFSSMNIIEAILNFISSYFIAFGPVLWIYLFSLKNKKNEMFLHLNASFIFSLLPNFLIFFSIFYFRFAAISFPIIIFGVIKNLDARSFSNFKSRVILMILLMIQLLFVVIYKYLEYNLLINIVLIALVLCSSILSWFINRFPLRKNRTS